MLLRTTRALTASRGFLWWSMDELIIVVDQTLKWPLWNLIFRPLFRLLRSCAGPADTPPKHKASWRICFNRWKHFPFKYKGSWARFSQFEYRIHSTGFCYPCFSQYFTPRPGAVPYLFLSYRTPSDCYRIYCTHSSLGGVWLAVIWDSSDFKSWLRSTISSLSNMTPIFSFPITIWGQSYEKSSRLTSIYGQNTWDETKVS